MFDLTLIIEIMKWVIYPIGIAWASIKIAKFHFEKDMKKEYLTAKNQAAIAIMDSTCGMLLNMWELVNVNFLISSGQVQGNNPDITQRRQRALANFHQFTINSYQQLGRMGLYYGTEIVDLISQLQSDLNEMIASNNFSAFDNWDTFRRQRLLPILQRVHTELRNTVFDEMKSFRLCMN